MYEHIVRIADKLGVSVDYLLRVTEVKTDTLTSQEIDQITDYQQLTDEEKRIISSNIKLLVNVG